MKLSAYGNGLLIFRVSNTIDDVQELINANEGNLKAVSDELLDLYKMRKRELESFHLHNHPKCFFHILDDQLKLVFRAEGRRFTFNHTELNDQLSLFPLVTFNRIQAALPKGVFRIDYISGPLTILSDISIENVNGYRWENNPFNRDLVQFHPSKTKIRADNQVIYRKFIINSQ